MSNINSTPELSPLTIKLQDAKQRIFDEWTSRTRLKIEQSLKLPISILTDTLPALYDNVACAISPDYPQLSPGISTANVAIEHGNERARLTDYDIEAVIDEYNILQETFLEVLAENGVDLSSRQTFIVSKVFSTSIRVSVSSFALVHASFREKFTNALVHDLRNPISTIQLIAELMTRIDDVSKLHNLANSIKNHSKRADSMINELLSTLVIKQGIYLKFTALEFDMASLIKDVVETSSILKDNAIQMEIESVTGWWGYEEMKRALENLVGNAIKYGDPEKPITVKCTSLNERLMIGVHNDGPPIDPQVLDTIFELYQRTENTEKTHQGWGIGLSYVKTVAVSHGGSAIANSSSDAGTSFLIDIPVDCREFQNGASVKEV